MKDAVRIIGILQKRYDVRVRKEDPFKVLVHGILSARTKDGTTFAAHDRLLKTANSPGKISRLPAREMERLIYPVGFYRTKARMLKRACRMLLERFGGKVPKTREELMEIPGVGPKVASLVQVWGFHIPAIPVDSHVNRVSQRLGFVPKGNRPERTQKVVEGLVPDDLKMIANRLLVEFGKDICRPTRPHCFRCPIYDYCRFERKEYYRKNIPK